jgi:hypothetical protein
MSISLPPSPFPAFLPSWPLSVPPSTQFDPYQRTLNIWASTWMDDRLGTLYVDGPFLGGGYSVALKKAVFSYIFLSSAPIGSDQLSPPPFLGGGVGPTLMYTWTLTGCSHLGPEIETACASNVGNAAHFHTVQVPKNRINIKWITCES